MAKITLCSSARFFDRLYIIKEALERNGHEVFLPSMQNFHHLEETALAKIHYNLMKDHLEKINRSDAIYVANYDKDGVKGYIGGSAFLEMGKAFDKGIPIFLMNDAPKNVSFREEVLAMQPIVIGENWEKLDRRLNIGAKKKLRGKN
ncbi:MAG: hypothetical protein KGH94_05390 [Candidatus Micrarchaeota archaeon]|nr:hypothetical protein [Candidatus Micrarchaeota archaeon]